MVSQVNRGDLIVRLADRDTRAELRKTKAAMEEKQANLKLLKAGPRSEQVDLAKTSVAKAEERIKYARSEMERDKTLATAQLVSQKELEVAEEQVAVREKELQEAREQLKLLLAGSRPEEIEALEAEINRLSAQQRYLEAPSLAEYCTFGLNVPVGHPLPGRPGEGAAMGSGARGETKFIALFSVAIVLPCFVNQA